MLLADWAEANIRVWEGPSTGERFRAWPYQREIMNAMADARLERVSIIKAARIGYTKAMIAALGARAATAPCAMILLVPTDDDARGFAVDEVDPAFRESPALKGLIRTGRLDGRNTLTVRSLLGGGSVKILASRAPRNLRRHDAKILLMDEIDAMSVTPEGDPLELAEKRTLAHADRKIIAGSTPTEEDVSNIERLYGRSDQRVFEVPCTECGEFNEILWEHIHWPKDEPEAALYVCPACGCAIEERHKVAMVTAGRWRVTHPEVVGHAGFRINALVSLFANANWGKLAAEYLAAKRSGPASLQVFVNTVLGRPWRTSTEAATPSALMERVEAFGLEAIPADVLATTAGVDVQSNRLEVVIVGWPYEGAPFVLAHAVVHGSPLDDLTWAELDTLLETKWRHPNGWSLGCDVTAIDSGGQEGTTPKVYAFCAARTARKVFAIKGQAGPHPTWRPAQKAKGGAPLFIVGIDALKTEVTERLGRPLMVDGELNAQSLRLSHTLTDAWFDQVTNERRFVRYVHNRPVVEWKPVKAGKPVEALDCLVYAFAAKASASFRAISLGQRAQWREEPRPVRQAAKQDAYINEPGGDWLR